MTPKIDKSDPTGAARTLSKFTSCARRAPSAHSRRAVGRAPAWSLLCAGAAAASCSSPTPSSSREAAGRASTSRPMLPRRNGEDGSFFSAPDRGDVRQRGGHLARLRRGPRPTGFCATASTRRRSSWSLHQPKIDRVGRVAGRPSALGWNDLLGRSQRHPIALPQRGHRASTSSIVANVVPMSHPRAHAEREVAATWQSLVEAVEPALGAKLVRVGELPRVALLAPAAHAHARAARELQARARRRPRAPGGRSRGPAGTAAATRNDGPVSTAAGQVSRLGQLGRRR